MNELREEFRKNKCNICEYKNTKECNSRGNKCYIEFLEQRDKEREQQYIAIISKSERECFKCAEQYKKAKQELIDTLKADIVYDMAISHENIEQWKFLHSTRAQLIEKHTGKKIEEIIKRTGG